MGTILVLMLVVQFFSVLAIVKLRRATRINKENIFYIKDQVEEKVNECIAQINKQTTAFGERDKAIRKTAQALGDHINTINTVVERFVSAFAKVHGRIDKVVDLYVKIRVADMDKVSRQRAMEALEKALGEDEDIVLN